MEELEEKLQKYLEEKLQKYFEDLPSYLGNSIKLQAMKAFGDGYAEGYTDAIHIKRVPSDTMIKKILGLAWEYNASDVEVNNLTEEGEFNYVKKHLYNE